VYARGIQAVAQGRGAHELERRVHPAGHQLAHTFRDRSVVEDDMICAHLAQRASLGRRASRREDNEAAALGEDRGHEADRRRAAANQQLLAALHGEPDGQRSVCRPQRLRHGAQRRPGQPAPEWDRLRDWNARELRVAAVEAATHAAHHRDDLLSDLQLTTRAGGHETGCLDAGDPRQGDVGIGEPEPGLQLGAIQTEGLDLDQDPAGLGLGDGALAHDQRLGRCGDRIQDDRAHGGGTDHGVRGCPDLPALIRARDDSSAPLHRIAVVARRTYEMGKSK
jgi:hypothetical protein